MDLLADAPMKWEPPADPNLTTLAQTGASLWTRDTPKVIAFDTETTGLSYHDEAFCVTVAWACDDVIKGPGVYGYYFELEVPGVKEFLRKLFAHAEVLVGHNIKFDMHKVAKAGIVTDWSKYDLHDTEAMSHLDDEHRPKGLKDLAVSVLGENETIKVPATRTVDGTKEEYEKDVPREKYEIDQARAWAKKHYGFSSIKDVGYHLLPRGVIVPYSIKDAEFTLRLAQVLHPRILRFPDLAELYAQEMKLTRTAIYSMEQAGMRVRGGYVRQQILAYRKRVIQHELDIERIVGKQVRTGKIPPKEREQYFNPASNPEIAAFFAGVGEVHDNYDAEKLSQIKHPLAAKLLAYRADAKLLNTYFLALDQETGEDNIYHQSVRQHGTVTGRTSNGAERGD